MRIALGIFRWDEREHLTMLLWVQQKWIVTKLNSWQYHGRWGRNWSLDIAVIARHCNEKKIDLWINNNNIDYLPVFNLHPPISFRTFWAIGSIWSTEKVGFLANRFSVLKPAPKSRLSLSSKTTTTPILPPSSCHCGKCYPSWWSRVSGNRCSRNKWR